MNSALSLKSCQPSLSARPLILGVEDDEDNLFLLSYAIEAFGCQFVGQSNSQLAFATAKAYQPDLILLDILMPNLDGIQLSQQFQQDQSLRQIPVIAVTALARAEDRQMLLQAGFTDYISKPYTLEDLETLIHHHLHNHSLHNHSLRNTEIHIRGTGESLVS